jgi:hypothetical protein
VVSSNSDITLKQATGACFKASSVAAGYRLPATAFYSQ